MGDEGRIEKLEKEIEELQKTVDKQRKRIELTRGCLYPFAYAIVSITLGLSFLAKMSNEVIVMVVVLGVIGAAIGSSFGRRGPFRS